MQSVHTNELNVGPMFPHTRTPCTFAVTLSLSLTHPPPPPPHTHTCTRTYAQSEEEEEKPAAAADESADSDDDEEEDKMVIKSAPKVKLYFPLIRYSDSSVPVRVSCTTSLRIMHTLAHTHTHAHTQPGDAAANPDGITEVFMGNLSFDIDDSSLKEVGSSVQSLTCMHAHPRSSALHVCAP